MKIEKPLLQNYLNIHHYLSDLYQYKKQTIPGFSYEAWAIELGFKDRSFLRQIVIGRRGLTESSILLLQKNLDLPAEQKEHFDLLCHYSKSKSSAQRKIYGRKLMQSLRSEYLQAEIENYYDVVSNHLTPKIQTLLSIVDIQKTAKNLATLLEARAEEVQMALEKLEALQLADKIKTENGIEWTALERNFKIKDDLGNLALQEYHRQSLQEAIKAQALPIKERRFRSMLLPLSEVEFEIFMSEFNVFAQQVLKKFDADDLIKRKLYQVNFNIHSVSKEPSQKNL